MYTENYCMQSFVKVSDFKTSQRLENLQFVFYNFLKTQLFYLFKNVFQNISKIRNVFESIHSACKFDYFLSVQFRYHLHQHILYNYIWKPFVPIIYDKFCCIFLNPIKLNYCLTCVKNLELCVVNVTQKLAIVISFQFLISVWLVRTCTFRKLLNKELLVGECLWPGVGLRCLFSTMG
eukprot:TRINITY_DN14742_c0_g1_i5.p2 TRINITY_DN14742_c0_g1~~TRINITY_DN14742_c0_g1_i5.p2  ORF type:complete len:178 (-),score=3.14 TRINITY_DN14742_c0_g1_i5:156-689(-)